MSEAPSRAVGGDALVGELRMTYASRLAGLFRDQGDDTESKLVLRLTGEEPVEKVVGQFEI